MKIALSGLAGWAVWLSLGGCGDDSLDPESVTSLPEGDATGSEHSGEFEVEQLTRSCDGKCSVTVDGFIYSVCDVGHRDEADIEVEQLDGRLVVDTEDSDYASRLEGGINADGSFEVGGLVTQFGGAVEITTLLEGHFENSETFAATGRSWIVGDGESDGEEWSVDCKGVGEVSGTRE